MSLEEGRKTKDSKRDLLKRPLRHKQKDERLEGIGSRMKKRGEAL